MLLYNHKRKGDLKNSKKNKKGLDKPGQRCYNEYRNQGKRLTSMNESRDFIMENWGKDVLEAIDSCKPLNITFGQFLDH